MNETEHMNSYLDRFETFVQLCAARQPSDTVPRHEIAILWHGYITDMEALIVTGERQDPKTWFGVES